MRKRGRAGWAKGEGEASEASRWSGRLRPLWLGWLTALFVATPLLPSENPASQETGILLILFWLLLLLGWSAAGALAGHLELRLGPAWVAFLVFVAWHCFAALWMARFGQPRAALNQLWLWLSFAACFFLARQLLRTPAECRAVAAVIVAMSVGLSAHGYYQYFYQLPRTRAAYEGNLDEALQKAGVYAPPGSPQRRQFLDRLRSPEPVATFSLTNSLAGFLSLGLVLAAGIAVTSWEAAVLRPWLGLAAGVSLTAISGCWILTKSRTAWLATLLGLALLVQVAWPTRRGRPRWRLVACGLAAAVLAAGFGIAAGGLDALVVTEAWKSFSYRIQYWQSTIALVRAHPWLGCGPGNFQQYYTAFKLPEASETVADPHNFLLEVAATTGLPGLAAFLISLGCFAWQMSRAGGRADEGRDGAGDQGSVRAVYWGALAGLLIAFFPCGYVMGFMPDLAILLLAAPAAAVTLVLWGRWVGRGRLARGVLTVGMVTLLTNLLAAGGISFAGVSLNLWVLIAAAMALGEEGQRPLVGRRLALALAAAALLLWACFYKTQYEPVLRRSALMAKGVEAWTKGSPMEAEDCLRRAARADPYDETPWAYLAELLHKRWLAEGNEETYLGFQEAAQRMLALGGRSSALHSDYGDWLLAAFRKTNDGRQLLESIRAYRRAVEFYPNHSLGHAQLAWALHVAGDGGAAAREAEEALRLDALVPHEELKLAVLEVHDPLLKAGGSAEGTANANAEQLMRKLRNATKRNN